VNQLVVKSISSKLCDEFDKLSLKIMANMEVMEMEVGSTLLQDYQRGHLDLQKMTKACCGTKEGYMCLM
jgi:hypothetical protein